MRPVPTVFLRLAFSDQLSVVSVSPPLLPLPHRDSNRDSFGNVHFRVLAAGYPQAAQT